MFAQELCHTKGIAKTRERTKEDGRGEGVRVKVISVFGVERPTEWVHDCVCHLTRLPGHFKASSQTWDSKMTSKIFIDMAASFWFFLSFLAKSISFYFRNQIFTALGFQKCSQCNKVLYISPWTILFYTSDVSLLTKKIADFCRFLYMRKWGPSQVWCPTSLCER